MTYNKGKHKSRGNTSQVASVKSCKEIIVFLNTFSRFSRMLPDLYLIFDREMKPRYLNPFFSVNLRNNNSIKQSFLVFWGINIWYCRHLGVVTDESFPVFSVISRHFPSVEVRRKMTRNVLSGTYGKNSKIRPNNHSMSPRLLVEIHILNKNHYCFFQVGLLQEFSHSLKGSYAGEKLSEISTKENEVVQAWRNLLDRVQHRTYQLTESDEYQSLLMLIQSLLLWIHDMRIQIESDDKPK